METLDLGRMTKRKKSNSIVNSVVESKPQTEPMKLSLNANSPNMSRMAQSRVENGSAAKKARQFQGGYYDNMANTAMANVTHRNNLKMGMEQNKIISNLATNKANIDSRERMNNSQILNIMGIAKMRDKTNRERMSADNTYRDKVLDIKTNTPIAGAKGKQPSKLDFMEKRKNLYPDKESFRQKLGYEVNDEISDEYLGRAYDQYLESGEVPQFKKEELSWNPKTWVDDDYIPQAGTKGGGIMPEQKITPQEESATAMAIGKHFGLHINDTNTTDGYMYLPDGKGRISIKRAKEMMNSEPNFDDMV